MGKTITIACKGADTISLEDLTEFQGDLKRLTDENYIKLRKQILDLGFSEPFSVWRKGRKRFILNGHQRRVTLLRMQAEGYTIPPLPVSWVQAKSLKQAKQKVLSLTSQYGEMTEAGLQGFAAEAELDMGEIESDFRFPEVDWGALAGNGQEEGETDADAIPDAPVDPVSDTGGMYELGGHRLMCGDATKAEDVARLMEGVKAGLMNTDPPYGIAYDSRATKPDGHKRKVAWADIENDDLSGEKLQAFLEAAIRAAVPHLTDNAAFYLWHPMLTQGVFFAAAAAAAADILIHRQIIWVKPQMIFGRGDYHWKHELCFYGWQKGNRPPWLGDRKQVTVWEVGYGEGRNARDHPTQKPVELFARPIASHLQRAEVCYEPFAGSGSQYIAAEQSGRRCYGLEIEPRYCDIIRRRWAEYVHGEECDWESLTPAI